MALRKKFIDVKIPLLESSIEVIGPVEKAKEKTIKLDLARKMRGKGLEITFKIFTKGEEIFAVPKKMILMKSYIKRTIRKNTSYVEDSFKAECKDIRAIVKPFLITRKKVSRAVKNNLRKTTKELILEYLKNKDYIEICEDIFAGELQKRFLPKLKKIYPLSFFDIRIFETKELEKANIENKNKRKIKIEDEPEEIIEEVEKILKEDEEEDDKSKKK